MYRIGFFALALLARTVNATVPFPADNFPYFGKIQISNEQIQSATNVEDLRKEAGQACRFIHRSLFAVESYFPEIKELIGTKGVNFPVLFNNREFYRSRLAHRYLACASGKIKFNLHGRCGTEQETVAFVKVTLGFVGSTIHICDEYFADSTANRIATLVDEYGRLENIGDSPHFTTNNIYVWGSILGRLGDSITFNELTALKMKNHP